MSSSGDASRSAAAGDQARGPAQTARNWDVAGLLAEPTRRNVLAAVRAAGAPVTREEVAVAVGIDRRLAAFHLDRLAAAGLLSVSFARPPGRPAGPGGGRPAKHYSVDPALAVEVSLPARRYQLVARILALAVARRPEASDAAALEVAHEEGIALGRQHVPAARASRAAQRDAVSAALADAGYEPVIETEPMRLRNCPFREVAGLTPEVVCAVNRELVAGLLEGAGASSSLAAELDGVTPPDCCVTVHRR